MPLFPPLRFCIHPKGPLSSQTKTNSVWTAEKGIRKHLQLANEREILLRHRSISDFSRILKFYARWVMMGTGGQSAADLDIVPCQGLIGRFGVPDWLIRSHSEEDTHWLPSNLLPFIYSPIGSNSEIKKILRNIKL